MIDQVQAIVDAYNYDRSDICVDYYDSEFFGHVDLASGIRSADLDRLNAQMGA